MHTRHLMARQGDQHWHPVLCWPPHHVHPAEDNVSYAGLAMSALWRMAKFQKTSSTENLPQGREALAACSWGTRMHAREDMKVLNININSWEDLTTDCTSWRSMLHKQLQSGEKKLTAVTAEKQAHKKEMAANRPESMHRCNLCNWDCHSHIGHYSHRRYCSSHADSLDK